MIYKVEFTPQGLDDISKLDKSVVKRIIQKIEWLAKNLDIIIPQLLKGEFKGMYKLVIGDWRVLYTADFKEKIITIHILGHRKDIYKKTKHRRGSKSEEE